MDTDILKNENKHKLEDKIFHEILSQEIRGDNGSCDAICYHLVAILVFLMFAEIEK